MTQYLISFPSSAMIVSDDELRAAAEDAHAVARDAKEAGVWVFGGGLNEEVAPVLVGSDGTATEGSYPETRYLDGGFTVLEVPTRDEALDWARKIAVACRCPQEVREFMVDPEF
jgi:hypothetical protein